MKRIAVVLVFIMAFTMIQTGIAMTNDAVVQKELLKNIQGLWKAWQNSNPEPFKQWLAADAITVSTQGQTTLPDFLKMLEAKQCQVKSFSIDEKAARAMQIDTNTYLITYTAQQDAVCDGVKSPSPVTVSEIWSNKDGKWKALFYQETHLAK